MIKDFHPLEVWDVLEGQADDGQRYTILRHATLGLAVELWHDSMGAFHLYLPSNRPNAASAVMCCFSSGIVVQEDTVCAPELLFELCRNSSCFETDAQGGDSRCWTRDPNLCLEDEGRQIWDGNGDRSWEIRPDGASQLSNGAEATNTIVISHALTQSELVLFYSGLIFVGGEPLLLPCSSAYDGSASALPDRWGLSVPDLASETATGALEPNQDDDNDVDELLHELELRGAQAPSDPVQLRGKSQPAGVTVSYSWDAYGAGGPSADAAIRHRLSPGAMSSEAGLKRRLRHSAQEPQIPGPLPPRFCGASSKWGAFSGLVSVSGHLQAEEGGTNGGVARQALALANGGDDGGRGHAQVFLRRLHTGLLEPGRADHDGTAEHRQDGSEGRAHGSYGSEMKWCWRVAQDERASEEDVLSVLLAVARNGWEHFFVTDPDAMRPRWLFAHTDGRVDEVMDSGDDFGSTPLMIACFHGHLTLAEILLSRGADPNRVNFRGRTCLFHALSPPPREEENRAHQIPYEQLYERKRAVARSLVQLLLQYNALADHADHKGVTPLKLAATSGYHVCAAMLVRAGADARRVDGNGFSVLQSVQALQWHACTNHETKVL
jgi:hypothetical protein